MTHVDTSAPVQAKAATTTSASPAAVFAVLADVAGWSAVYPELRDVQVDGPTGEGSTFRFKSGPMQIEAAIVACEVGQLLAFEGKARGASSAYEFAVAETDAGTELTARQSMDGLAVKTMKPMLQKIADTSLQDWVEAIAAAAESS